MTINFRFEDEKQISSLFEEVWEDITSGERVTLQLFLQEIVNHICESITSSSWASKKKATFFIFLVPVFSLHCFLIIFPLFYS